MITYKVVVQTRKLQNGVPDELVAALKKRFELMVAEYNASNGQAELKVSSIVEQK